MNHLDHTTAGRLQEKYRTALFADIVPWWLAPAKAHAYDVRAGKYLGQTAQVKLLLEPAHGTLVAFLPYQAKALTIRGLPKQVIAGARVATLCRKIQWTGGLADFDLAVAFNDPPGDWKITVTDVATGTRTEEHFHVSSH
jgi:hypothetical protein